MKDVQTTKKETIKKKRSSDGRPVLIDLSDSPPSTPDESPTQPARVSVQQQQHLLHKADMTRDFKAFQRRLNQFSKQTRESRLDEVEIERVKLYLDDWITTTSSNLDPEISVFYMPVDVENDNDDENNVDQQSSISPRDVRVFRNYLLYLLAVSRDLEKLSVVIKIFKRLAYKCGSPDWISIYQDVVSTVQSEFYIKYDHTLEIN